MVLSLVVLGVVLLVCLAAGLRTRRSDRARARVAWPTYSGGVSGSSGAGYVGWGGDGGAAGGCDGGGGGGS